MSYKEAAPQQLNCSKWRAEWCCSQRIHLHSIVLVLDHDSMQFIFASKQCYLFRKYFMWCNIELQRKFRCWQEKFCGWVQERKSSETVFSIESPFITFFNHFPSPYLMRRTIRAFILLGNCSLQVDKHLKWLSAGNWKGVNSNSKGR